MQATSVWLCILAAGCGVGQPEREPARAVTRQIAAPAPRVPQSEQSPDEKQCIAHAPDTRVRAQIIERGAALVFTTSDDVSALRRRAADLSVAPPAESKGPRLDNVQHGVRFVFEVGPTGDPSVVQRDVIERARRIAKRCGLVLASPSDKIGGRPHESGERQTEARALPSERSTPTQKASAPRAQDESKAERASAKPPAKSEPKPGSKSEPAQKPNEPAKKPGDVTKPKKDKKPSLPRLPGPHPDPIVPGGYC